MQNLTLPLVPSASKGDLINGILQACRIVNVTLQSQIAYLLATGKHETDGWRTLEEYWDGDKYSYFANKYGHRDDIGNRNGQDGFGFGFGG